MAVSICIRLGNLGKTEPGKLFRNFKWLKNREDGFDYDYFWINRIAPVPAKICKLFAPSKNCLLYTSDAADD